MSRIQISNPQQIAELGETIYQAKYQTEYEAEHEGKFVAIEIHSSEAYLGDTPEEVLTLAREKAPYGIFHLIKIGSPGAF
jgi:hypothetical protein